MIWPTSAELPLVPDQSAAQREPAPVILALVMVQITEAWPNGAPEAAEGPGRGPGAFQACPGSDVRKHTWGLELPVLLCSVRLVFL